MIAWVLRNPYASLFVPPALILAQFAVLVTLLRVGLPESMAETRGLAGLLVAVFAGLAFPSVPALLLAVRQAFLLPRKLIPCLGIVANGFYFGGFLVFFVLSFMIRTFG